MRDVILTLIVVGLLPLVLARPHIGILVWSWLGYMNPHRLTYGFAYSLPFAQITAICLLISLVFSKEPKKIPITPVTIVWILFFVWMGITTMNAWYPEYASEQYGKVLKIQVGILLTLMIMGSRERLHMLVWVIFLSIGFYSIKGGLFTLTGGGERVWGPAGSMIFGNNELALATLMIIPLGNYLRLHTENKWIKRALMVGMLLSLISALGSYSRGAFLGTIAVGIFFWWKSKKKFVIGMVIAIIVPVALSLMPQQWFDRMGTIENYQEDSSANERLASWSLSISIANDDIFGGGFNFWSKAAYQKYGPEETWDYSFVAHSIYLHVAGEHGWVGLGLFLLVWILVWRNGTWIIKQAKLRPDLDLKWAADLAAMMHVSLIAYATAGAFLSLSYFDLPWHIMSIFVLLKVCVEKQLAGEVDDKAKKGTREAGNKLLPKKTANANQFKQSR